jgi:vancomycin permeability regulator SanA
MLDLRAFPRAVCDALVAGGAVLLVGWSILPARRLAGSRIVSGTAIVLGMIAAANATGVWVLMSRGTIHCGMPVPASALLAVAFLVVGWQAAIPCPSSGARSDGVWTVGIATITVAMFPVLQVFAFGHTDYRRTADLAVVPGARVHADGSLSMAVDDRVITAAGLYRAGRVRRILMSGGPGDGSVHETEAMRDRAIGLGVRAEDIATDRGGINTAATVANAMAMRSLAGGNARVLVVSEFYHLPRLKLAFQRAGLDVTTVPAKPGHWLRNWPLGSVAREIPAFWSYAFRRAATFRLPPANPVPEVPC